MPIFALLCACNTFASPEAESTDAGPLTEVDLEDGDDQDSGAPQDAGTDAQIADGGDAGMPSYPPITSGELSCPEGATLRRTFIPSNNRIAGDFSPDFDLAWSQSSSTESLVLSYVDSGEARIATIDIPVMQTDSENEISANAPINSFWGNVPSTTVGGLGVTEAFGSYQVVSAFTCPGEYAYYGALVEEPEIIAANCMQDIEPVAADLVGGYNEFLQRPSSAPFSAAFVERFESTGSLKIVDLETDETTIGDIPAAALNTGRSGLRGTTGELFHLVNRNFEAFVGDSLTGLATPIRDESGVPLTLERTEFDVIHLDGNRYVVSFVDGFDVVVAIYHLHRSGSEIRFDLHGVVERVTEGNTMLGAVLAPFSNGFALLYFEALDDSNHRWTIRPYTVLEYDFTAYACESRFGPYGAIDSEGVRLRARRSGTDLVVQQANSFTTSSDSTPQINVEGYVFEEFF